MMLISVIQGFILVLLVGIAWLMPALVRPTLPFGVRIPLARAHEPAIARAVGDYRRLLLLGGALLTLVAIAATLTLGLPTLLPLTTLAGTVLCWAAYYRAHRQLADLKAREGWYEGLRQGLAVDTTLRSAPPRAPFAWAIPAVAIAVATLLVGVWRYPALPSTIPLHFDAAGVPDRFVATSLWSAFGPVLAQWAITALIIGLAAISGRWRADLDVEALAASSARHRRTVAALQRALLLLAATVALTFLGVGAAVWGLVPPTGAIFGAITLAPFVGIVGFVILIARAARPGDAAADQSGDLVTRDDDAAWRGGAIYVNRDDPALLVPKRFGIGWTLNFGHPAAWGCLVVLALIVVFSLIGGIFAR